MISRSAKLTRRCFGARKKAEPSLGLRHRPCDERGLGAHVRIDEGQQFRIGRGCGRPAPAGLRLARPAGLKGAAAQASDERVTLCERSDDFVGAVVGIVVDDSDAEPSGRIGLDDEALQALPKIASLRAGTMASTAAGYAPGDASFGTRDRRAARWRNALLSKSDSKNSSAAARTSSTG